ncbi:MAG: NADP-dependent malic enzyme [Alphaproteobacteria bacterium]|nr:NADP-dependent malic enzyme [Alphaproteobacteria bacterium]
MSDLEREALLMHASGRPGKIEVTPTKPMTTQRDLSLAYSPGVAFPCLHIARDPSLAYDYTAKGNLVAVISNGTAVLGLGDLGALAGKPVMEGKAVLFKRFADVDAIDLEVDTKDVEEFINCVRFLGPTFGGINLEDIKAPECFIIESRLREMMDIPVFHDDQHGTAIIATAGLMNALDLTGRTLGEVKVVVNGAGAAAIACVELIKAVGVRHENVTLCDTKGVIWQGRTEGMNQWKSAHAVPTQARTLTEAMKGADVFMGLSVKGAVTPEMIAEMAPRPIIFAMANPDPEITPEEVKAVRSDAIVATGRSDYPNQVNNVLGFPYIFRGALDVRARTINEAMKIAAARAIARLAREDVPDEVDAAYAGRRLRYGPEYIIPVPFDPRLIAAIPLAVAEAAMASGVARKPIVDIEAYRKQLSARLDPTAASLQVIAEKVRANPCRMVFAEGEEEKTIRAALAFRNAGYGTPVLLGREDKIAETMKRIGLPAADDLEIVNARISPRREHYIDVLYRRLQRKGHLLRDVQRLVNQERNVFGALMVAEGDAHAMITGITRNYWQAFDDIKRVIDPAEGEVLMGLNMVVARGRTVFMADTTVHETPTAEQIADIATQAAAKVRKLGYEPRVALLSFSTFGNPASHPTGRVRQAVEILDRRGADFEYDGEMGADVALDPELLSHFPFCRLKGPANVLVMPGLHSANISSKLVQKLGGGTVIGPILTGLSRPIQISSMDASANDIVNMAVLACYDAIGR